MLWCAMMSLIFLKGEPRIMTVRDYVKSLSLQTQTDVVVDGRIARDLVFVEPHGASSEKSWRALRWPCTQPFPEMNMAI